MILESQPKELSRILGSIGKKCPLGCIYCFVDNENYLPLPKIDGSDCALISSLEADIIQPAADVEFFLSPSYLSTLESLIKYGKTISFATKSRISIQLAQCLVNYHNLLLCSSSILQISVSIVRLREWKDIEPFAPSPKERLKSLRNLYECGIPTIVSIRPMLPFTTFEEIEEIVNLTHHYTYGYHSGPVYLTPNLKKYMIQKGFSYSSMVKQVKWLPNEPFMEVIFSPNLENHLKMCAEKFQLPTFASNIEVVQGLKEIFIGQK